MSGSGKTSLTIISLIAQLVKRGAPVFVVDLGGDISCFHNASRLADKHGRRFRYFTLDPLLKSYHFPPVQTARNHSLVASEVCQRLLRAFNLDYGTAVYGATYYAAQAMSAMLSVADKVFAGNPAAGLEEMDFYLNRAENRKQFKDADSIRMNVRFMLQYPQLSRHEDPEENIDVQRAIEHGEVTYFFLPTLDEPVVSPLAAGLLYSNIVHLASLLAKSGAPRVPIYVIGDESQEIVGRSLGALLVQGRKYGLRFVFANQSTNQLQSKDCDLRHVMFEGTAVKQYFTCVGDDDTEVLQSVSRDKRISLGGTSVQGISTSVSFREEIARTLERDEILEVSATMGRSFFLLNNGQGHVEPYVVQQEHEFPDLSDLPMPMRKIDTEKKAAELADKPENSLRKNRQPNAGSVEDDFEQRARALIGAIRETESWRLLP